MEKKTIGALIAALRKANGMTQKELADKLFVSDKTVSRWERDESAPDLSVIPVLAEIFGVTCDELLRGERKSPSERESAGEADARSEKQKRRLLKQTLARYQRQMLICDGVAILGLLVALVCNLAFLKALLGFLLGAAFFAASFIAQAVCRSSAFQRVEDAELDADELSAFKRSVLHRAHMAAGLTAGLLGFTVPLLQAGDAYLGLNAETTFQQGFVFMGLFLLVWAIVCFVLNGLYLRKGVYTLDESQEKAYRHNRRLQACCAGALAAALLVTGFVHQATTSIDGPFTLMEGTVFEDYESFAAYMAQPGGEERNAMLNSGAYGSDMPVPVESMGDMVYYDEYGNEISEEEALTRTLEDRQGRVVYEYIDRNQDVCSLRYTPKEDTVLPITVYTWGDQQAALEKAERRHLLFAALYAVEVSAALLVYWKKRAK